MKKGLRIAHIFASDPTQPGGVQSHVYYLSLALAKRKHQVTVFSSGKPPIYPFPHYQSIGQMLPVPMPNGNWTTLTFSLKGLTGLTARLNNGEFDLCHIHEPYIPFINWQLILLSKVKLPIIATFHSAWDGHSPINIINPLIPLFRTKFSNNAEGVIFVSKTKQKRWRSLCPRGTFQAIIPNAVDHSLYKPFKKAGKNNRIKLLFVGRIVPKKGLMHLLKSLVNLKKDFPALHLTVIGDGPERERAEDFAMKQDLNKNTLFLGNVIREEKKIQFYQSADIFCAPYIDESFGITVLEAMACGCPITGFKNTAFSEILKDYPAPELLTYNKNAEGLTQALSKLILNQELSGRLRRWCLSESQKYNWDKVAAETEDFYREILKKGKNDKRRI